MKNLESYSILKYLIYFFKDIHIYINLVICRAFLKHFDVRGYPAFLLNYSPLKSYLYFLLGKIYNKGQFAGNSINNTVSSETKRIAYGLKDDLFKYWFIGFLEGKGSFNITKNNELEFKIVHVSNDASVLFNIKKLLGFGVVRILNKKNYFHCFKINDKDKLLNLISIINGNIFLESKQKEFKLWLEVYNKKYGTNIIFLKNTSKPVLLNSWLSGFIDAIGSFSCIIKNKYDYSGIVKLSFLLSQKENFWEMNYLAELLKGKVHFNILNNNYEITVNTNKFNIIIHYLSIFSLKTNKRIIFFNIKKIYILIKNQNKNFLANEDLNLIKRYIKNINKFL
jgi:hypothetical protein